jgi:hypothetical protein
MLFINKKTPIKNETNVISKGGEKINGSLIFQSITQNSVKRTTVENMSKNTNQMTKPVVSKTPIEFALRKENHFTVHLYSKSTTDTSTASSLSNDGSYINTIHTIHEQPTQISRSSKIEPFATTPPSLDPAEVKQWIEENIQKKIPKLITHHDVLSLMDKKIEESTTNSITKDDVKSIEEKIKEYETEIITLREQIANQNEKMVQSQFTVESYIEEKMKELPTQQSIEELVDKYLTDILKEETECRRGSGDEQEDNNHDDEEDTEESKTRFEHLIEPAVARIVQRIIKYDYAHGKEFFRVADNADGDGDTEMNLDIQYDEVYDYKRQVDGSFELPAQEIKHPSQQLPGMYNPLYERKDLQNEFVDGSQYVDLVSVYKKEESLQYENELRSEFRSSRKWARIGSGIEKGSVLDMCLDKTNRKVYIVGHFKHVNRVPMDNIAVYNMNDKGWHNVGNGVPSIVTCIAIYEESQIVFVGGVFTKVGKGDNQITAHNIAAYYVLQNRWVPLGEGLNSECSTLYFDAKEEKLYAGGTFTSSGNDPLYYFGMYDLATNSWSKLYGGELSGPCRAILKVNETDLYLGGLFTHAGSSDIHVSYVAHYNLEKYTWSSLAGGLQGHCNALAYDEAENAIYVGGTFSSVGEREKSLDAHHIAKFYIEHQTWDTMDGGLNNVVHSLCFDTIHKCLYVGGNFTHTFENDVLLNRLAIYIPYTRKWSALDNHFPHCKIPTDDEGNHNVGLNGVCKVLNMDHKSLFIAGSFQIAGNITANSIVRYILKR